MTTLRKQLSSTSVRWMLISGLLFLAANMVLIAQGQYALLLLPAVLLIAALGIFRLDLLLLFLIFITPLSVPLREIARGYSFDVFLPTEPILVATLVLVVLKLLRSDTFDRRLLFHPVSLAIYAHLAWMLITAITSTMPVVSFKFLLSRIWFVVVFYFLLGEIFLQNPKQLHRFFWLFILGLFFVIAYSWKQQYTYGLFDHKVAHWASGPFFNDHTAYGASLAFYVPFVLLMLFHPGYGRFKKLGVFAVLTLLVAATVMSYTRAAWLSLVAATAIGLLMRFRIRLRYPLIIVAVATILIASNWTQIMLTLEKNQQESSSDLASHIQSMTNIANDASNLERLNRWKSAFRMFDEKPVLGWGPGTYMFQYAPFQRSYERTIISTNFGDMGNAHSEYIGPLAEQGVGGPLFFLLIVLLTSATALRTYRNSNDTGDRLLVMAAYLGLVTYYVHGLLNNFLDTDKASLSFWGFTAVIIVLDIKQKAKGTQALENNATA